MKRFAFIAVIISVLASCDEQVVLKNTTAPRGYAMGEFVNLSFSTAMTGDAPDSIETVVIEKNTGYRYRLWARRSERQDSSEYNIAWDGRKADGSWPSGGRYFVFGSLRNSVFSDTVQIGLGD